jgi:Cadherin domain
LIHYSIINPPIGLEFPFVINSTTGIVRLRSALDYETTRSYRFLIRASDSGSPQSLYTDTWLSISIKDVNDCPVEIHFIANQRFQYDNQTLFIYENTEIKNLTLGYIRLIDRDLIQTKLSISLIILDEYPKQDYELILSNQMNSYALIVKQGIFDRELQSNIKLRFRASDSLLISIYDLNIHLIDLNDNSNEFHSNPLKFSIEELANYQMIEQHAIDNYQITIGYLNATDRDEGENALNKYELQLQFNAFVKIDSNTGRLFLIQPLDREQITNIELKAKAINIAEPKWESEVQIQINV